LESVVEEYIVPPGIAMIIDCLTENKAKTRMELRTLMKRHGATPSSISYLFQKKGVIKLKRKPNIDLEAVLLNALDAGALDVEEGEKGYIVFTEASNISTVGEALESGLSVEIDDAEVIWDPESRLASVPEEVELQLMAIERRLQDMPSIRSVYTNAPIGQR
jgi:transcriptional/translational regulatory protein YebC/TACO1